MASNLTQMICVEGIVIKASIVRPSSIDAHPTSASATTPSTSTAAASASTSSSSGLTSRLGDVALDVSAAHVSSVHGLDGSLRLVRRGERDEGESFPGIVSIGDSSMLLEGSPQILLGSLLGHVVNEQLGFLHILLLHVHHVHLLGPLALHPSRPSAWRCSSEWFCRRYQCCPWRRCKPELPRWS